MKGRAVETMHIDRVRKLHEASELHLAEPMEGNEGIKVMYFAHCVPHRSPKALWLDPKNCPQYISNSTGSGPPKTEAQRIGLNIFRLCTKSGNTSTLSQHDVLDNNLPAFKPTISFFFVEPGWMAKKVLCIKSDITVPTVMHAVHMRSPQLVPVVPIGSQNSWKG